MTLGPDYTERERREEEGISERSDSHGGFTVNEGEASQGLRVQVARDTVT